MIKYSKQNVISNELKVTILKLIKNVMNPLVVIKKFVGGKM